MVFADRVDAGRRLAAAVRARGLTDAVVLALPRGGVPVAAEVARGLGAPLDVIVVRKLGVPGRSELAMGAIGEGGARVLNDRVLRLAAVDARDLAATEARERAELDRRSRLFRGSRARLPVAGRTVVVVDDGIATGSTVRAACLVARAHGAGLVVVAAPVAPAATAAALAEVADEVIVLETPAEFAAIGQFYRDFTQTSDAEVVALLDRAGADPPAAVASDGGAPADREVVLGVDGVEIAGDLCIPRGARAFVVFAHGSGSSRSSPRNRFVASVLQRAGLGTLLFDLLTPEEERERARVFDIPLLARRLAGAESWLRARRGIDVAATGFFGASTGAGAALWAAAAPDARVGAVVSRGGRPDLAGPRLTDVRAPTLLVVGARDEEVLALNRAASARMRCERELRVVPGASHLFTEPGTLAAAAGLARDWFVTRLRADARAPGG